ncbi:rubredoxin-like domain-containing protein [Acidobacteriota bacterium]
MCPQCSLTFWKCGDCGYLHKATMPPEECPSCKKKCEFRNVSCYTPECGGPGHFDPRLT